jgi:hypothetical protein
MVLTCHGLGGDEIRVSFKNSICSCRWTMRFEASEMENYLLKLVSLIFRNKELCTISCFRRIVEM